MNHNLHRYIKYIFQSVNKSFFSLKNFSEFGKEKTKYFAKKVGFNNSKLSVPIQVHSSNVKICLSLAKFQIAISTFTNQRNIVCSIQVADCLQYISHRSELFFGLIHAGWRGLVNDIILASGLLLKNVITTYLILKLSLDPRFKIVVLVGDDIIHNFQKRHFKTLSHNKFKVDLQKLAFDKFVDIGLRRKTFIDWMIVHCVTVKNIFLLEEMVKRQEECLD